MELSPFSRTEPEIVPHKNPVSVYQNKISLQFLARVDLTVPLVEWNNRYLDGRLFYMPGAGPGSNCALALAKQGRPARNTGCRA